MGARGEQLAVLMYHATYGTCTPQSAIEAADRPYAVSESAFVAHLVALQTAGYGIADVNAVDTPRTERTVLLSFDDGHVSNARFVAPTLAERELNGVFFITTDWVDARPHFCAASDLREMRALGMQIGSHGCSHRFIADLDASAARAELADSKAILEGVLGAEVDTISFPGGRCGRRDVELAFELGYRWVYGSEFKLHRWGQRELIGRLPVREGMAADTVVALCDPESTQHRRARRNSLLKSTAKRVLGNGVYDAIYRQFAT
ncbi:MAG: polysaccharide deacetylase family protein [Pseudomonadota bacterium]